MGDETLFAKRLREAREEAGLSQRRLGMMMGLGPRRASVYVNRYERGAREPGFHIIQQLADVLTIPASYFLEADDTLAKIILIVGKMEDLDRQRVLDQISQT